MQTETRDATLVNARYWHSLDDGRIQCDLCPRYCKLHDGQRGLCFVRARRREALVLTTYGRSSGFCVDPIEKKPLNHFYPGTSVLSFGTAGCNLTCRFCQNWDISKSREMDTLADTASPETIAKTAHQLNCRSVAYTYNDPIIFLEYAIDTAVACKKLGIRSVAVTAGYMCKLPRHEFYQHIDAANIDLKSFREDSYWKVSGAHLQPVLDTLCYVQAETETWLEITTLLIPYFNDSDREISELAHWIHDNLGPDVPLHFSAFHPAYKMRNRPSTPPATLSRARKIAMDTGLHYVYTGNVYDPDGQSTYCHRCETVLIGRSGYEISHWALTPDGHCQDCGAACAGVFEAKPGTWGSKRLPIRLAH